MSMRPDYPHWKANIQSLQESLRLGLAVVTELWFYQTSDWVTSVHAADIDRDGDIEVLVGSRDGGLHVLTKKGGLKWKFEQSKDWIGTVQAISNAETADAIRVVFGSRNNKVYALDEAGRHLWQYRTNQVVRRIRLYDINNDGKTEILVASEDWSVHVLDSTTGYCLWKYRTNGWVRSVFASDIDGDGEVEVLVGSGDKYLYVLDNQGRLKWKYNAKSKIQSIYAADLDGDGIVEILIASDAKDLYALTPDQQKKWTFHPANRIHSINVADLTNDGHLEVIAGSEDEHIYFLDDQGNLIWKHFLGHRIFSVFAIDLNIDNIWEIIVGADDNCVHVLRVELTNSLLEKITAAHQALQYHPPDQLGLSATESGLLQDLTDFSLAHEHPPTIEQAELALLAGQWRQALSILLKLDQQRVQLLWQASPGYVRAICLGDFLGNSDLGILVGTEEGGIHAFDTLGNKLWSHPLVDRISSMQLSDVDGDGLIELVAGSIDGHIYALNPTGDTIKWQAELNERIESIYVSEADMQGHPEIVVGSEDKRIHIYGEGFQPLVEPIKTPQGIRIVCTYDLNGDAVAEIIAGAVDDNVYAYTRDGLLLWVYHTTDRVRALRVEDIDGDGHAEIIVGSEDRNVYVLNTEGLLKWRYYTPHRVLAIDVLDIDHDGQAEVLVGVGNGHVDVLSGSGDLLWQYKVNDRVRVIRAADINGDGAIEIVVGTEDVLYVLQMVNRQQIQQQIESCWQQLTQHRLEEEIIYELAQEADPYLRLFALTKLAPRTQLKGKDLEVFRAFLEDPSSEVRRAFASRIAMLYRTNPVQARRFFDKLTKDQQSDVRFAFIDSLPALAEIDPLLGFEYLDRFTRNANKWVRRAVVRRLEQLAASYPQQVAHLLQCTMRDEAEEWIRQESARTMAYYLDLHPERLLTSVRLLITKGVEAPLFELIMQCSNTPIVQSVCRVFAGLLSYLTDANTLEKLQDTVNVLAQTRTFTCGEIMWKVHSEFYRLHRLYSIDEIARYKCAQDYVQGTEDAFFEDTLRVLYRLSDIATILRTYLRREGLGDRLASLLEATTAIETLQGDIMRGYFWPPAQQKHFTDWRILEPLLPRWRAIVTAELGRLRGKADLKPELQTRSMQQEEVVAVWLSVSNDGRSPADNVEIKLKQGDTFSIVGPNTHIFETIPTREPVQAEFAIRPRADALHLTFAITYDDAEARGKLMHFGDRIELVATEREFKRIPNPYSAGIPIQDSAMFYGREEEIRFLKESLAHSTTNAVVVVYGQRRSGKSSLLYHLINTALLEPHIPIYIDMQHEALNISTVRFLYNIARYIYRQLKKQAITMSMPRQSEFAEDPTFALDMFLDGIEDLLKDRKLVLLIDEFEVLEQKVTEQALDREIFAYLRSLMQHRRGISFLLSGTHTIEQLTAGYWSVFFNIARHHRLSRLRKEASRLLMSKPVEGYLAYDEFALRKIRQLTGDQPYLIQLICRSLVDHCNAVEKNYVTINDVNIVHNEVMETGQIHFKWIWDQTSPEERLILAMLAQEGGEEGRHLSLADIEGVYQDCRLPYIYKNVQHALHNLAEGDIIESVSEETRFRVPVGLTRRWLREAKPLRRVIQEEDFLA